MIARAYLNTKAEIARLSQLDFDAQVQRYNTLEQRVFGSTSTAGADAVSFRDAVDRADRLENQDAALQALGTAELSGDQVLAKAIVLRAWQANWDTVVERYAVTHPTVTDQLAELGSLRHNLDSTVSRFGGAIGASLGKPTEIADKMPDEITRLAPA